VNDATLNSSRRATAAWAALFVILCLFGLIAGLETALHFVGPAIDGPFQLYNSLRRIFVGQRGGADFQFFHGIGIPYLHYIPFRLLGGNFIASELTRESVSSVLYPITDKAPQINLIVQPTIETLLLGNDDIRSTLKDMNNQVNNTLEIP